MCFTMSLNPGRDDGFGCLHYKVNIKIGSYYVVRNHSKLFQFVVTL